MRGLYIGDGTEEFEEFHGKADVRLHESCGTEKCSMRAHALWYF